MEQSIFDRWIIAGGWAMILLIPVAVVALATVLRGLLYRRIARRQAALVDDNNTASQAAAIQPLLWIYALAPLIGAAGTATLLSASKDGAPLVPLLWGIGISMFAGSAWFLLQVKSPGQAGRGVLIIPGIISATLAFVLAMANERGFQVSATTNQAQPTLYVGNDVAPDRAGSPDIPVLAVTAEGYFINGQSVAHGDVYFRLSALASRAEGIILQPEPDLDAGRLTEALALVNQAGFVHVGVDTDGAP